MRNEKKTKKKRKKNKVSIKNKKYEKSVQNKEHLITQQIESKQLTSKSDIFFFLKNNNKIYIFSLIIREEKIKDNLVNQSIKRSSF